MVPRGLRHVTKPRLTTSTLTKNRQTRKKRCRSARAARPKPNSERWLAMDQMRRTIEHEKRSVWEGAKCVFPTGFSATRPLETSIFINSFILFCFPVTHTWLIVPRMTEKWRFSFSASLANSSSREGVESTGKAAAISYSEINLFTGPALINIQRNTKLKYAQA